MNPYEPPYTAPYVLHWRLGVFIYRRLFQLPTEALKKRSQGQYWSLEGAPTVPNVIGSSSIAAEGQLDALVKVVDRIKAANQERAAELASESRRISIQASDVRAKVELALASKRLRGRCDLVPFF